MSRVLRTVGKIAGAVAIVAGVVAAIPTGGASLGITAAALGTASTVASIAGLVATAANLGAQLTAKKPPARGSISQLMIGSTVPSPYLMGRTYSGGVLRHDVGYGATLKKVPNPYRGMVVVYSVAGPVQGLESVQVDFSTVSFSGDAATGYYSGFMYRSYQLGASPEASALSPHFSGMPSWGSSSKLSGKPAILFNLKFDKDGKVFAGGVPQLGAIWQGVKVYDPRKDSTYPGGSGAHRITNEATWEYSECPSLHGLAYLYGRRQNGKKVFGVGQPVDGIEIADFVTLANVCDTNGWKVGGAVFEPGDRWANLKEILAAGGAEPAFRCGKIGLKINAPSVSLDTITADDLADGEISVPAQQTWRDRLNTIIPKYRSEAHKWDYVASAAVTDAAYLTQDGEPKVQEVQWNLVQDKDQVAQLAAYLLVDGRELGPIELNLKPRMRLYKPGDKLTINIPDAGLSSVPCKIIHRQVDPATLTVQLTLMSETAGRDAFALGKTGTAPPTPTLTAPADYDALARDTNNLLNSPPYDIYDTMQYGDVAGFKDAWNGVPSEGTVSDGNISLVSSGDLGGQSVQVGDNSGYDLLAGSYFRNMPFDPEDLYEATFDVEFGAAHASAVAYLGVRAEDASGGNLASDSGTFCYVAASNFAQNGVGRKTFVGYFRGRAATGAGNNVGALANDRASPTTMPNGTVSIRPLMLLNYHPSGSGTARGVVTLHSVRLRKIEDVTLLDAGTYNALRSYFKDDGVKYNGRLFGSKHDGNLGNTPPSTSTSNSHWYYVLEDGATGATGSPGSPGAPGSTGSPGTDAFISEVNPATIGVRCDFGGTPKSGELARIAGTVKLRKGTGVQTSSVTYAIVSQTGFTGMSIDSSGNFGPPTGVSDAAAVTFKATFGGIDYPVTFTAVKIKDGNPTIAGGGPFSSLSIPASGTFAALGSAIDLPVPNGSVLNVAANINYGPTASGVYGLEIKFTYQDITGGGSETDFTGGPFTGANANTVDPESISGGGSVTNSSGATHTFRVRMYGRRASGSGSIASGNVNGSFTANV